jgi:hypothetical protein
MLATAERADEGPNAVLFCAFAILGIDGPLTRFSTTHVIASDARSGILS